MARLLVKHAKKQFIQELGREVVVGKGARYFVKDTTKPYSTLHGTIPVQELEKPDGSTILTESGKEFTIFSPCFIDFFKKIKRLPQAIPLKDIGCIISECGIGPDTRVLDAGCGSGALACMLARICKSVVSYDIEDTHIEVAKENKKALGLQNLEIKKGDITLGPSSIPEREMDVMTLDIPNPWDTLETAKATLRIGGFLVSYSPSMAQSIDFNSALAKREDFILIKTIEILEREWEIEDRKVRPKNKAMIHSGFLTFARRIR